MKERGRTIDKQSVDAMHVVEMHVDQIHMGYTRVSGDLYLVLPILSGAPILISPK